MSATRPTEPVHAPVAPPLNPWAPHAPSCRWLSNGRLAVLLTAAGTGFARRGDVMLTRWRGDRVEDQDGVFVYLRDLQDGPIGSIGLQPVPRGPAPIAEWSPGVVTITRADASLEAVMETCVAPDADVELRRITLRNREDRVRRIEVTTYAEVVLSTAAADEAHPAFSKLFVETEVESDGVLLARRRPRAPAEQHPWMAHALFGPGEAQWETDRERFIGRGCSLSSPTALREWSPLSGSVGSVLDPVFSVRRVATLEPGASATLGFALGIADRRGDAIDAVRRAASPESLDAMFRAAARRDEQLMRSHDLLDAECEYAQALAGAVLYGDPRLRAPGALLERARGSLETLRRLGLSDDRLFVAVDAERGEAVLPMLAKCARYWRAMGLGIDVVVVGGTDRERDRFGDLMPTIPRGALTPVESDFLFAAARFAAGETLPELAVDVPSGAQAQREGEVLLAPPTRSGGGAWGNFVSDGKEYEIGLQAGSGLPPAPWINVMSREDFGCFVSETGAGSTWSRNSREHRITPWFNDPVLDPAGESWCMKVETLAPDRLWKSSALFPGPTSGASVAGIFHGFGASRFVLGFPRVTTDVFVPHDAPLKVVWVRLTNPLEQPVRVTLASMQRLVLGGTPGLHGRYVRTSRDDGSGVLFARSMLEGGFQDELSYAALVIAPDVKVDTTTDRAEFVGRGGTANDPAALRSGALLSGRVGAGLDPCFGFRLETTIEAGGSATCAFLLGTARNEADARACVTRFRRPGAVEQSLEDTRRFWESRWSGVQVEIPAPELQPLINGWLPYQTLSCRMWGRSALYQSGGAYGYRDQLQDAASLLMIRPELTRAQIVLHAAHQFAEGDVLHWWHPGTERGLRTRFADDLLWLPYVTAQYVESSGDTSVLDEPAPYLTARALEPGEDEAYLLPEPSGETGDVYDHCCRALDRSLATGAHGLPRFGTGDWNDGMNRVGREGRGESVWMGFFLCAVIDAFAPLCRGRGDRDRERRYLAHRGRLASALNEAGWDGDWYRRGFYDDGAPLGSRDSDECQIDALVQAWAVLSGVAPRDRAERCMAEVERRLISDEDGLIRLLTPPFDRTPHDPGYIKGYVPGVRENGGQYTHAALWVVRAFAMLGRRDRAARLLSMLSPITHTSTPERMARYRLEPYVVAADVYGAPPHVGRGGWSWYTGSSGWMYRVALESVLGLSLVSGKQLRIQPCIPDDWPEVTVRFTVPGTESRYDIVLSNPEGRPEAVVACTLDGRDVSVSGGAAVLELDRAKAIRRAQVRLGAAPARASADSSFVKFG